MRIHVLGPVEAHTDDGTPIDLGGTRIRALLARLALAGNDVATVDALLDGLWGEQAGGTVNALHALVHRLRKALAGAAVVERVTGGYRLEAGYVDALRFEELARRGARELAGGSVGRASSLLDEALALWRGHALADVRDIPFAATAGARLDELRAGASEDRFEAALRLGEHGEVLADLEAAAIAHPLRERLAGLRMRALHAAGRQSDALAAFERVRDTLAEELGVDPSPRLRETHLAVLRGEPTAPRPERVVAPGGRLPAALTSFVGREDELRALDRALDDSRLVTIVGPGGAGKTRLAVEAAGRHRAHARGRVWLVPLADAHTAEALVEAVLGALSPAGPQPPGTPLERIAAMLTGDEGVLILDNCEQLTGAAADLAAHLLARLPDLTILATSREPLDVIGEALCRLGPLGLPPEHAEPEEASGSAAVRLFLDRATAVQPGLTLDAGTTGPIVDIVRRLDGLPLALELAAARLRSMSAEQIARRLDDRFRLLSTGNRGARPRQQTLRAVIAWSWDLLSGDERALARRMSVIPARTGPAAIEAVCADAGLPAGEIAYLLDSLVDKSIVERSADGYRMLETIRAHAGEHLRLEGEDKAARAAFTRHFAALAAEHEPLLRGHHQEDSLRLFHDEHANLVHALHTAIEDGDGEHAAAVLAPLYWYWVMVRYDARADDYVARTAALGEALPAPARAAFTAIHRVGDREEPLTDPGRLRELIEDCAATGALERHPMLLTTVLVMAPVFGLGDLADREIARVRAGTDEWAIACTHMIEAMRHRVRGDGDASASAMATALRLFERVGDRWWAAKALYGLAQVHAVAGEHDRAVAAYEDSLAIAVDLGSQDEVSTRLALATERMRGGDLAGARHDVETAETAVRRRGQPVLAIEVLAVAAELSRRSGDPVGADRELDRLEELAGRLPVAVGYRLPPARMANRLGAGDAAGARALLPGAVEAARAAMDVPSAGHLLARLLFLEGDAEGAATALGLSRAARGAFDHGDTELRALRESLVAALGRPGYDPAFQRGAELSPDEAAGWLMESRVR
ncbi:SARP family transcriptional regulator [Actinorhabdospora filicis]|uniref:SARP family transcriptional regulator n=1 Tax=Actinorhabdospora filicis TaxID=1785913 RepID=A0A9W6SKE0_9ACTN|nr:BTAD domain-containing putative transcriptional regulator [Actinorhabdospora filicis]GLZ78629.1 SARP family transcriptional regulator [Actinorhabdospora filicis]